MRAETGCGERPTHLEHLILLRRTGEERVARVEFEENAAQRPHVNFLVVGQPQQDLWRSVEPRLDVRVHCLADPTTAAEINQLDRGSLRVLQQNVLRFEIAVDDGDFGRREEEERVTDLLGELLDEVERDAPKRCVPNEVVEVVTQMLEHQTQVVPMFKRSEQPYNVVPGTQRRTGQRYWSVRVT